MADFGLALPELEFDLMWDEADACKIGELVNDVFEYLLSVGPLVVGLKHVLGAPLNGLNTELLESGNESDEKLALAKNFKSGGLFISVTLSSFARSTLFVESEYNLGDSISLGLESILEISSSSSSSSSNRLYEIEFRSILNLWSYI